jgi:hypothetical protein
MNHTKALGLFVSYTVVSMNVRAVFDHFHCRCCTCNGRCYIWHHSFGWHLVKLSLFARCSPIGAVH